MYDKVLKAYKIEDKNISPFQKKHTSYNKKFNIVEYSDVYRSSNLS